MMKICLVTSTRAEYGIMNNLIKKLSLDKDICFRLCVTGSHLCPKYGYTRKYIDLDNKYIDEIDIVKGSDDVSNIFSNSILEFDGYFKKNKFDIVILLGDRYEIFAIASIAYINKIKIAHIHGGENTYGALDEQFRHCITKLSNIHFPSCEKYRDRIIQMGEMPSTVFNVGSLSVENIMNMKFRPLNELNKKYNFQLNNYAMVTFNPVTSKKDNGVGELLELVRSLTQYDYELLILYPNMDSGNNEIIQILNNIKTNKTYVIKSLEYLDYLSFASYSSLFIGNSSSGIIEIPSLNVPIINVGERQSGRESSKKVISCEANYDSICNAIEYINNSSYYENEFKEKNIYQGNDTSNIIINKIKEYISSNITTKIFYDFEVK